MVLAIENDYLRVEFTTLGAAMTSLKSKDGIEYLWQGNPEYWSSQAPILFPICGSIRDDQAIFTKDGQEIIGHMLRHGIVRKEEFKVEVVSSESIRFSLTSTPELFEKYPYEFKLNVIYTLRDSSIICDFLVENLEEKEDLPYFVGGHPAFNCPLFEGEDYTDYYLEFEQEETTTVPTQFPETGLLDVLSRHDFLNHTRTVPLDFALFEKDAITLDKLTSREVSLKSSRHSHGLTVSFKDLPNLILWTTTNQGPFIALEPWSGLSTSLDESNYFMDKANVSIIKPQDSEKKAFQITVF